MLEQPLRRPHPIIHRLRCLKCRNTPPRRLNANPIPSRRNVSTKPMTRSMGPSPFQQRWQHTSSKSSSSSRSRSFSHLQELLSRLRLRFVFPVTSHPLFRAIWPPLKYLLYAFPILKVIETHVGQVVWINGASMYPALNSACYDDPRTSEPVWVDRRKPALGLERGMIVSFR